MPKVSGRPMADIGILIHFTGYSMTVLSSGPKKFQKLLWAHRPSKPTIGFLEMLTPMWGFVCLLLRLHVKLIEYYNDFHNIPEATFCQVYFFSLSRRAPKG